MDKFYITTSIPYANAVPHIGFALEVVQADVLARYHKSLGENVFYLTGTDEHGLKIKKAAQEVNKSPQEFVDEISVRFKELTKSLNICNDDFIRTTEERHKLAVEKLWEKIKADIYKKKYKGYYCSGCEAFVTGKDLVNNKCLIHKKEPEFVEEENYFFKLSNYLDEIKEKIESNEIRIIPETRKNEVLGYIKTGIKDISFSRVKDKYWGFEVPGDNSQIIYVWGDALPNYISAIGYEKETKQFKSLWPADVHCIGKDILKFHALLWPAMLLAAGLALPKAIFVHGFITVAGQKMSKSLGNVVDPFELVARYGPDAVRYYLLREIPSTEDGDFTVEKFEQRYNADLASGIGNLVARVSKMAENIDKGSGINNPGIEKEIQKAQKNCKKYLEEFKFSEALRAIWELISFCDKYIEKEKPWEQKENSKNVLNDLLFAVDNIADLLDPFLPETSEKIRKRIIPLFPRI
ncbi:methionyl-tRNA synthetase [Parcubacteria bacterium DG_72]|nr:MAG: methionyl-tRNA synthetase [Parcubacteria bacterium DG_72]